MNKNGNADTPGARLFKAVLDIRASDSSRNVTRPDKTTRFHDNTQPYLRVNTGPHITVSSSCAMLQQLRQKTTGTSALRKKRGNQLKEQLCTLPLKHRCTGDL
ncbi:hypothetical protein ANAPC5_01358 [Anaplasma phagocytophilum]|nr:hypothetical protein ANAPC5_01358 [Anaplasma phagocytophilum]